MSYQEYAPQPLLAKHIKCFWVIERDFGPLHGTLDLLPDSYIELIFNIGSPCEIDDGHCVRELPACYLVTLFDKPLQLRTTGILKTIGVRFFAWEFLSLMDVIIEPSQTIQPLNRHWQELAALILRTTSSETALELLHTFFVNRLTVLDLSNAMIDQFSQLLFDKKGHARIDELADICHLSRRQMERKFQKTVGLSPKTLARRIRFEQVRDFICGDPHCDLSVVAIDFGYSDQSHLSRDFKYYSNRTPVQFITEIGRFPVDLRFGVAFPGSIP